MKIIWFVKVISRTRFSKKYLNKIGVNGKRVALITWPMTYLFGRSHMRVSWYKMKKKRHENKWCVIQWQLEIYKNGRFYKLSLKNCTIKPRNKKIKIKKVFLFLIYKNHEEMLLQRLSRIFDFTKTALKIGWNLLKTCQKNAWIWSKQSWWRILKSWIFTLYELTCCKEKFWMNDLLWFRNSKQSKRRKHIEANLTRHAK